MFYSLREVSYHAEEDSRGALAPLLSFMRTWKNPQLHSFHASIFTDMREPAGRVIRDRIQQVGLQLVPV
jgi:hypothetical protein